MQKAFDFIIIGTGMGGATIGHRLAQAGAKVLFLEQGNDKRNIDKKFQGQYAETFFKSADPLKNSSLLHQAGRFHHQIKNQIQSGSKNFFPFIGSVTGGSTSLYGGVLERFLPEEFESPLWPIKYSELAEYYELAEQLFGVEPKTAQYELYTKKLSQENHQLWQHLKTKNLHPYHLPLASRKKSDCVDTCQSRICKFQCKSDAESVVLRPAIEKYQAELFTNCEVLSIEHENSHITGVHCRINNEVFLIKAKNYILAAGALSTPALLLKSRELSNQSGYVGRNLMRHLVDFYLLESPQSVSGEVHQKQIGLNDFYYVNKQKFGTLQSFGNLPPAEVAFEELSEDTPKIIKNILQSQRRLFLPFFRPTYQKKFQSQLTLASIMEDSPQMHNYIEVRQNQIHIHYQMNPQDQIRLAQFRQMIAEALSPLPVKMLAFAHDNRRIAHVCGTCKFGDDSNTSVIDRFNRSHQINNLYIVDASFFPTSGGTNPSLTIAANALRVGEYILKKGF
jgi:choline dehydrogenase-like flavoprotein